MNDSLWAQVLSGFNCLFEIKGLSSFGQPFSSALSRVQDCGVGRPSVAVVLQQALGQNTYFELCRRNVVEEIHIKILKSEVQWF